MSDYENHEHPSLRSRVVEFFWRLLPDKCEMPGCCRQGVRGNENIVDGKVMCDYCHAAWLDRRRTVVGIVSVRWD